MRYFYVISPIGADPEFVAKKEALSDAGRRHSCEPFFPLDRHSVFSIETAREDLKGAALVLGDLSYERPSCYFELGLAQALNLPVILIATEGTRIHQVAYGSGIRWYGNVAQYRALLNKVLTELGPRTDAKEAAQQCDAPGGASRRR